MFCQDVWQEEEEGDKTKVVKYTDIRNKFPNLLKEKSPGVSKTLFHQDSGESQLSEQVRVYIEGSPGVSSRGGSEIRDLSETSVKSCSSESLKILESLPDSPEKGVKDSGLPKLTEKHPLMSESPNSRDKSLERSNSRANLEKTPVTLNDPLGALSSQTSPMTTPVKPVSPEVDYYYSTFMSNEHYFDFSEQQKQVHCF